MAIPREIPFTLNLLRTLLVCVLPAVLLVAANHSARALREHRLGGAPHAPFAAKNAASAPMIEFVNVALGGFRGLAADMLWLRAGRLQEERRFVELAQLSDWITKLEPRLAEVWVYHAWNMAYNISVLMPRPEDRWLWIQNGIELLRDNALPLNPRDATIQRELGWFFQHKIGADSDLFHAYYRTRWAALADQYLAPGGAIPADDEFTASELLANLKLEPSVMREIESRFGRIDWRVPMAQSLYWAWRGLDSATGAERLACRRMIYVSLRDMTFNHGQLVGDPSRDDYFTSAIPNPALPKPASTLSGAVRCCDKIRHPGVSCTFAAPNHALLLPAIGFVEETMDEHTFGGIRGFYIGFCREGMLFSASVGDHETGRLLHARIASFLAGFQLPYPPYEQALLTPPDYTRDLMRQAGFY